MDEEKLGNFMNRALNEAAATYHAALVVVGDKLGLYKTLAKFIDRKRRLQKLLKRVRA